ncbi:MAG TPA: SDR family NAD(P)-dependent oxidoreductase [Burkholderiales bacterium]|nr:SDR family NAD(P)-dependent oxidoreductase [Burkholderiales bacterium]
MDEQNVNRRQMLGGAAAVGAAAVLGSDARAAQPAKSAAAAEPVIPDMGDAQAPPIKDVKDKVAYITGGSSGIGLGIARALHERGAKVILGNLDDRQFADALKMFPPNDARVATVIHNVMERDGWEAKADEIEKKFGPVSILVNNAGVGVQSGVLNGTYNDWDWLMGVNLWGPVYGVKTFAPRMRARPADGCHIVTTTSTSGVLVGLPNGIYAVTKFAATGLMEQLRADLRETNIGTSALIPGITQTNIAQSESHRPDALKNAQPYAPRMQAALRADPGGFWSRPQDPIVVGRLVVDGILNNDLFIFPAPEYRQGVEARAYAMLDSMVSFVPTPDSVQAGIDANRYLFTPLYAQEVKHRRATRKRSIAGI